MIGQRLRQLRERMGLDQVDLGAVMGYGQSTVSLIEGGERRPSVDSLLEVAKEYGVSMQWLFGLTDEMTPSDKGEMPMKGTKQGKGGRREITPEEAIANYELIMDEEMLSLKIRNGNLDVYDMADIADYIRKVRSGEVQHDDPIIS